MSAKFIVLEGLDGSGKTTLAKAVWLKLKFSSILTQEPERSCFAGREIREALSGKTNVSPRQLARMFASNRKDHLESIVRPALANGKNVICDRYLMSSFVYQLSEGLQRQDLVRYNIGCETPDVTIFLDTPVDLCVERMHQAGRRAERFETSDRMIKHRELYFAELERSEVSGEVVLVDGRESIESLANQVVGRLLAL